MSAESSSAVPGAAPPLEVSANDLPVFCPNPAMVLWSTHPRVFLPLGENGEARCPYCGTRYRLAGDATAGHH
ncbi:MAG: zinc-finger domain-containing protein [Pseudomonadota bacterium]|nr:zinc-finger domain-containing protein [Pseudomonadota bacterium]